MGLIDPAAVKSALDADTPAAAIGQSTTATMVADRQRPPGPAPAKDMVWVPGGGFLMGSEDFYPEERPVHRGVVVDGFGWTPIR